MFNNSSDDNLPKICIIGAGPSGITAAKNLIEQGLTKFTVFEKNSNLGGNWIFDEKNNHSSIYETTHIISSKRMSEYEDFPMPDDYPDYPSHKKLLKYFYDYVDHFDIKKFIKFNTTVLNVNPTEDKKWHVVFSNIDGNHEEIFDYIFVANGHHWDPITPDIPGNFNGDILHSHLYKKADPFKNQRVLVVGCGNSACDVAVEISRISKKTCISIRRGQHIFPKFIFGKPTDIAFAKIYWMPLWLKQFLITVVIRIIQGRYKKYQLKKPKGKALEVHPTINSELLYFIRHGKISPRQGISKFEGNTVHFTNQVQEDFDTIIFATGYKISFPFFSKDLIDYSELTNLPLYRKMIHPKFDNLFFIGLFQPQGCIWPLADYQAKYAASIIKGTLKIPDNLVQKIENEIKQLRKQFKENTRHALEVDYKTFRQQLLKELKNSEC